MGSILKIIVTAFILLLVVLGVYSIPIVQDILAGRLNGAALALLLIGFVFLFPIIVGIPGGIVLTIITVLFTAIDSIFGEQHVYQPDPRYFDPSRKSSRDLDEYGLRDLEQRILEWRRILEHQIGRKVILKAYNGTEHYSEFLGRIELVDSEYVVIHRSEPFEVHQWIALENVRHVNPYR
jgi:hypothetical protein